MVRRVAMSINQAVLLTKMQNLIQSLVGVKVSEQLQKKLLEYVNENYQEGGFENELDFVNFLEKKQISSPEIKKLITKITIAESYFFRHKKMLNFIENEWLPKIIAKKRQDKNLTLRIWSAGCSAGQELYSIAILLDQKIVDIENWNIHLIGTDIDSRSLSQAKLGKYRAWSFREKEEPPAQYFRKEDSHYWIADKVKNMTDFYYLNLVDSNYPSITSGTNNLDLILCCNVIIYLDQNVISHVLRNFSRCLNDNGLLILGPSDILNVIPEELLQYQESDITFYKKSNSQLLQAPDNFDSSAGSEEIYQYLLLKLFKKLNEEDWVGALALIEKCEMYQGETALLCQLKANAFANLGDLKKASEYCNKSLALDSTDAHTYLIKAMISLALKNFQEAENLLRQALVINSDFIEVRFHLALLLLNQARFDEGLALLYAVRELIKTYDPERKVHHAPRLNFKEFAGIIDNEIAVYEQEAARKINE